MDDAKNRLRVAQQQWTAYFDAMDAVYMAPLWDERSDAIKLVAYSNVMGLPRAQIWALERMLRIAEPQ